jgi:leucyl-tRNA synthetase
LLYARLFVKALFDMGYLGFEEPFARLFTLGMITREGAKMSKSRGNVVTPAPYVERYGADTARCYMLFIGPPDQDADWSDEGVEGVYRFLGRLWRIGVETAELPPDEPPHFEDGEIAPTDLELLRKAHWAIDKVTNDMAGRFAFNTAIAAVMELVNACYDARRAATPAGPGTLRFAVGTAASLIFPFAPHCGADVYDRLYGERVWEQPWPRPDPALLERDTFELVCQVNGRVRDRVQADTGASREELASLCRAAPNVRAHVDGREVVKEIVVPGKLVNLVVR